MKDNKYTENELQDLACNACDKKCSKEDIGTCLYLKAGISFMRDIHLVRDEEILLVLKKDYESILFAIGYERIGNKFVHHTFSELDSDLLSSYEDKALNGASITVLPCIVEERKE